MFVIDFSLDFKTRVNDIHKNDESISDLKYAPNSFSHSTIIIFFDEKRKYQTCIYFHYGNDPADDS